MENKNNSLEVFMDEYLPVDVMWTNLKKYILDSGVELVNKEDVNWWLPGYTNIMIPHKPHHEDTYKRNWEENLFLLHDVIHQTWSMDANCSEDEYVQRQLMGEFLTFYYTEFFIPVDKGWLDSDSEYFSERGLYHLMLNVLVIMEDDESLYDVMFRVFIDNEVVLDHPKFGKISDMFKMDMKHSRENYSKLPKDLENRATFSPTCEGHMYHLEGIFKGCIKNNKKDFNLNPPTDWL